MIVVKNRAPIGCGILINTHLHSSHILSLKLGFVTLMTTLSFPKAFFSLSIVHKFSSRILQGNISIMNFVYKPNQLKLNSILFNHLGFHMMRNFIVLLNVEYSTLLSKWFISFHQMLLVFFKEKKRSILIRPN